MKNRTIVQLLKLTLAAIIALALIGTFVSSKVAESTLQSQADAHEANARALLLVERIRLDMLVMSDSLRGLLLDPTNNTEEKRKLDADADLTAAATEARTVFKDSPSLLQSLDAVEKNDEVTLNVLEDGPEIRSALGADAAVGADSPDFGYC